MSSTQTSPPAPNAGRIEPIGLSRSRRGYATEFKLEAVRRVIECGESIVGVARDLGIHRSTLGRWKRQLGPRPSDGSPTGANPDYRYAMAPLVARIESLRSDPMRLAADSPEARLRAALRGRTQPANWSKLLAEGVAAQRRLLRRIAPLSDRESGAEPDPQLIRGAVVGQSLIKDTQDAIDRMIHAGRMATAKQLAGFRRELRQGLSEIVDRVGLQAFRRAVTGAETTCNDEEEARPTLRTVHVAEVDAPERRPPTRRNRQRAARPRTARNRSRPLLFVLAAAVLLLIAMNLPRLNRQPLPVLGFADFRHVGGISEITARPPSLYVEVDPDFWNDRPVRDRKQLIGKIGVTAHRAGYRGVHCTTTQGEPIARWLRHSGTQLIGEPEYDKTGAYVVPDF